MGKVGIQSEKQQSSFIPQLTVSYILAFVSMNFNIVVSTTLLCYNNSLSKYHGPEHELSLHVL